MRSTVETKDYSVESIQHNLRGRKAFYRAKFIVIKEAGSVTPQFLSQKDKTILRLASFYRMTKLYSKYAKLLPVIAYYPTDIAQLERHELPPVTEAGEILLSPSSQLSYAFRKALKEGTLSIREGKLSCSNHVLQRSIERLYQLDHIFVSMTEPRLGGTSADLYTKDQILSVSEYLGLPSQLRYAHSLLFNGPFFLLEPTDMDSYHSNFGQPYGLVVTRGKIILPPIFNRGAIIWRDGSPKVSRFSLQDIRLDIGNESFTPGEDCRIFTRFHGRVSSNQSGRVHLAIVNNEIVGYKEGGEIVIPDAGFILSIDKDRFTSLNDRTSVKYHFKEIYDKKEISWGVQGGPIIINNGEVLANFPPEEFISKVPPTVFPFDWNQTPAARVALGFTEEHRLCLCIIEGCSDSCKLGLDSRGVTLNELGNLLERRGVTQAVNLDGGGSACLYLYGSSCIVSADRKGLPNCSYERPIPLIFSA